MSSTPEHVKIKFRAYSSVLEQETIESMWTIPVDEANGLYQIDNIPFYLQLIASDDIIHAEYDESEGMLTFRSVVDHSGNSIIHVVMTDGSDIEVIRNRFRKMGCASEKMNEGYFALEVLYETDYNPVQKELAALEKNNVLEYQESTLSDKHHAEIAD